MKACRKQSFGVNFRVSKPSVRYDLKFGSGRFGSGGVGRNVNPNKHGPIISSKNWAKRYNLQPLPTTPSFSLLFVVFSTQVLQEEGEEAYFAAFEAQDSGNYRTLGEDGFVDAIVDLAPGKQEQKGDI